MLNVAIANTTRNGRANAVSMFLDLFKRGEECKPNLLAFLLTGRLLCSAELCPYTDPNTKCVVSCTG